MKKSRELNPFLDTFRIEVVAVNTRKKLSKDSVVTDAVAYERGNAEFYYFECRDKTSFYHDPDNFEMLFGRLGAKGRDMLWYIMDAMPKDQDWINLKISKVRERIGIYRGGIIAGIKELQSAGILSPKGQSIYWVNPRYIFKGNRVRYFRAISEVYIETVTNIKKEK